MKIDDVHVFQSQPLQADFEILGPGLGRRFGREVALPVAGFAGDLGGDEEGVAGAALEDLADDAFVGAALIAVGGIQMGDPGVQGGLDEVLVVGVHDPHGDDGERNAGLAQGAQDEPAVLGLGRGSGEGLLAAQGRWDRGQGAESGRPGQAVLKERSPIDVF